MKKKLTQRDIDQLIIYARMWASVGCAGPPACEPVTEDVATGKREGGLCSVCEASEWLAKRGLS